MKIGVISDTHDNIETTLKAISFFEREEVDAVIHCGDMVSPFTAKLFEAGFDFYAVRGNNDGEWDLKQTVSNFGEFFNNVAEIEFDDHFIAVYHGTEESVVDGLVKSGNYNYVLRGHTHQKKLREVDGTMEINPGGIKLPSQEEEFHIVILNLETEDIEFHRCNV